MKRIISSLSLLALAHAPSFAQQKAGTPNSKAQTSVAAKPKSSPKVDIVGAAVSKDARGAVMPLADKEPFKFYTNPDKELLTIEFSNPAFKNSEIVISDNNGKSVKQVQLEGNQTKINVNTQRWDNGIYVIVLTQHTTQQTIMQKIVLNR
jgi:hypothetical protein